MENKPTPGPWRIGPSLNDFGASLAIMAKHKGNGNSVYIAEVYKVDDSVKLMKDDVEGNANAHLIVAAPDLLQELVIMCNWLADQLGGWLSVDSSFYPDQQLVEMKEYYYHLKDAIAKVEGK